MSEFREASAAVAALSTRLETLRATSERAPGEYSDEVVAEVEAALEAVRGALDGELDASMGRFRARCAMVDPVTQTPRFGPKMLAKVSDMLAAYDEMKKEVLGSALLARVAACVEAARRDKLERERQEQEQRAKAERERSDAQAAARARSERQELEQRRAAEEAERRRVEALARAAQLKREQRARERQEEARRAREEHARREALHRAIEPGKEALERALGQLRESTGSETAFRNAVEKLLAVVANVVASPENAAFRHIPRDNANFHADIGQFDGGHQSLLAMGFRELQQDEKALFVLEEPDLSEDLDKWSAWFDNLKEMHDFIATKLRQ